MLDGSRNQQFPRQSCRKDLCNLLLRLKMKFLYVHLEQLNTCFVEGKNARPELKSELPIFRIGTGIPMMNESVILLVSKFLTILSPQRTYKATKDMQGQMAMEQGSSHCTGRDQRFHLAWPDDHGTLWPRCSVHVPLTDYRHYELKTTVLVLWMIVTLWFF